MQLQLAPVFTRVSCDHLPDDSPQKDIRTCNFRELVTIKDEELKEIQNRYKILVARILIEKFPKFKHLKTYLSKELPIPHFNSETASCKSEVITMPVLMKDEKKYSDCVDVLDLLEEWTHLIYKANGMCKRSARPTPYFPTIGRSSNTANLDSISHLKQQILIHFKE